MVDAICNEIRLKKHDDKIGSIYFGGGTPTLLNEAALQQIFDALNTNFFIEEKAEITIEANPDDLTAAKLKALKKLPINRFSIGIQSFFDEDLLWMNRAHQADEAVNSVKRSQDAGFENLSLDLIYGYPLLSDEKWLSNLNQAVALGVPHLSAYALTVEPRTALAQAIKGKKQAALNDEQSASQFILLMNELTAHSYEHYEISNFALPGCYAIHNTNYWRGVNYLGIGPSAHGFDGQSRYLNPANNALYIKLLADNKLPQITEILSENDCFNEYVMTALRTQWGIDLNYIAATFGNDYLSQMLNNLATFKNKNWLLIDEKTATLSQSGKLFADYIAATLFVVDE